MKFIGFVYGIIAYVAFFAAILYAIGFTGHLLVPKDINSGATTDWLPSILINLVLLSSFALQHSIMARPAFKKWFTRIIPESIERSTYVLLSSLILLLLYWQWRPMTEVLWSVENEVAVGIIQGLFFLGWIIVFVSSFLIDHFHLFGLRQVFDKMKGTSTAELNFTVKFLYRIVRHPLMLGLIIAFWATPVMTVGHLLFSIMTTAYIFIAVKYFEEKDLQKVLGEEYVQYQKEVPMLIPFTGGE